MKYNYIIHDWFFGFDIAMELLFAVIVIALSIVSARIYFITRETKIGLFSAAFGMIGISYIIWATANILFVKAVSEGFREITFDKFLHYDIFAAYAFMVLFTTGLLFLVFTSCDFKGVRAFSLVLGLSLMVIGASQYKLVTFRILSVFFLIFIVFHYINEYATNKNSKTFWILIAFTLLMLGSADFMFSSKYHYAYVIGHVLELSAYLVMLSVLVKSIRQ